MEEIATQFARKFNLPREAAPQIIHKKRNYYEQIKKIEFYPFLLDMLNWIDEKELKRALVTGGDRDRVIQSLDEFGMTDRFQVIITADDVRQTKPSPEPYLVAAQLLDVLPEKCVVIENAPWGIRSAKAAEMRCIAVTSTLPPIFLKEADVVADNLHEVLNALKRMY